MNRKRLSNTLKLVFLLLLIGSLITACSSDAKEATPTEEAIQIIKPTVLISSDEPSSNVEPNPTLEPTAEAAPTVDKGNGGDSASVGQTLLEERCTECHSLSRVRNKSKTLDEWKATVEKMVGKGAELNASEQDILIEYLAKTYP